MQLQAFPSLSLPGTLGWLEPANSSVLPTPTQCQHQGSCCPEIKEFLFLQHHESSSHKPERKLGRVYVRAANQMGTACRNCSNKAPGTHCFRPRRSRGWQVTCSAFMLQTAAPELEAWRRVSSSASSTVRAAAGWSGARAYCLQFRSVQLEGAVRREPFHFR